MKPLILTAPAPITVVQPRSGRWETVALLAAGVALVLGMTGYLLLRPLKVAPPVALSWQVRSFDGLSPVDQAIHSALLPAGQEIIWNNDDTGGWISLERAQAMLLPPFYRDTFWKANGEVSWQLILPGTHLSHQQSGNAHLQANASAEPEASSSAVAQATQGQGATVYYGTGGKVPGQSAYLLVIGHAHAGVMWANQATIWIHRDANAPYPAIVKAESLVGEGWRQVIPYDGSREIERVKGALP